jgi:hypothetical protein
MRICSSRPRAWPRGTPRGQDRGPERERRRYGQRPDRALRLGCGDRDDLNRQWNVPGQDRVVAALRGRGRRDRDLCSGLGRSIRRGRWTSLPVWPATQRMAAERNRGSEPPLRRSNGGHDGEPVPMYYPGRVVCRATMHPVDEEAQVERLPAARDGRDGRLPRHIGRNIGRTPSTPLLGRR